MKKGDTLGNVPYTYTYKKCIIDFYGFFIKIGF